ncbi:MAG: fused response regulator/phosphatase [Sulfurimonas sp.]|nr:fused response regulator/phosphatase [Sulfurimonas sp.]
MQAEIDDSVLEYLKSLTLLCVEDNKTTQLIYNSIFEDLVGKIIFAYDGEEGYKYFINEDIDIIISDYDMPILNGLDMIDKIRKLNRDIPIVLVTAIQEIGVTVKALQLNVNNFLKKPIKPNEVMRAIENVSKILIAENYLKEKREKRIKALQDKDDYNSYQEDLAFSKELNILRNDFYYQMIDFPYNAIVNFFYKPLDVVSGDAYSVRRIDEDITFYLIVDGMGKGLSASLSAMLMTSFINHLIDKMNKKNSFDFNTLIELSLEYIKPILLSEEALAVDYITIYHKESTMRYAKFAMPSALMQTTENKIIKIKSNNPPISKYIKDFRISTHDISDVQKFLFYSDGIVENTTTINNKEYIDYIQDDFINSFSKEDMIDRFLDKVSTQEDDITFIFINRLNLQDNIIHTKVFDSNLDAVDEANSWYSEIWKNLTDNIKLSYNADVVFTEMFMNAFEHGNLAIDANTKHNLLVQDTYFSTLRTKQKDCNKKIFVTVSMIKYSQNTYIATQIKDEGKGFDTQTLGDLFKKTGGFNGRGVYISKKSSMGIYYNRTGNSVLFLHKS